MTTALRLASEGSSIAVGFFRNRSKASDACAEIEGLGVKALPIKVHAGDAESLGRAFDEVGEVFGSLDVFVSNAVSPGVVDADALRHFPDGEGLLVQGAERTPAGRPATPEDVAGVVSFLCSPDAEMIRGQVIVVDGGACLAA